jgi:uncharacterized protein DUF4105
VGPLLPIPLRLAPRFLLILLAALFCRPANAATASAQDVETLAARARALQLGRTKTWLRLGHWRRTMFGGFESEADGPRFFLSPAGKTDPDAELDATIRAFFREAATGADVHPLCRFPARLLWLTTELSLDPAKLPQPQCPKLEAYLGKLNPKAIRLIFSSYYLNNPASAFGHTFLRVDRNVPYAAGKKKDLLDYGVDFSADVDTGNALLYAFKGLAGLFPGTFKLRPYFYKVREYGDYESRDLWEYELGLSQLQVVTVVLHLWEMGETYFDYFYVTENCAYQILAAIEVADTELELLRYVKTPVVPVDTIKALLRNRGLVKSVHYRPSVRSQFKLRAAELSGRELGAVEEIARDSETSLEAFTVEQRVRILDAALDYVDFRYAKELVDEKGSRGARLKQRIEERRAEILVPSADVVPPRANRTRPELSHDTARLALGSGVSKRDGGFASASYRLALHDLADPPLGFPELSQIEFMSAAFRFEYRPHRFELENLALVRIISVTPVTRFDRQFSWKLDAGATRLRDEGCSDCVVARLEFGAGGAVGSSGQEVSAFVFADTQVAYGPRLDGIRERPFRVGVGPSGGLRVRWADHLVSLAWGQWLYLPWQAGKSTWMIEGVTRWELGRNVALGISAQKQPLDFNGQLMTNLYF